MLPARQGNGSSESGTNTREAAHHPSVGLCGRRGTSRGGSVSTPERPRVSWARMVSLYGHTSLQLNKQAVVAIRRLGHEQDEDLLDPWFSTFLMLPNS